MPRHNKIKKACIAIGIACIFLCGTLQRASAQNNDYKWLKNITSSRNLQLEKFEKGLSFSVYPALVLHPTAFIATGLIKKDTTLIKTGLCIVTGIALNVALTYGLKYTINRERPYVKHPQIIALAIENSSSMPSGHTSGAFNLATSLTLSYPKWYVAAPSYLWASGVAYSRMYIGVHYPSDVFIGALLGSGTAWLNCYINKKYFKPRSRSRNR